MEKTKQPKIPKWIQKIKNLEKQIIWDRIQYSNDFAETEPATAIRYENKTHFVKV